MNNEYYDYSVRTVEPAVVEGFNNKYYNNGKGRHAIQIVAPMNRNKNAYDCILHRDFQVTNFNDGKVTFFDVKYVTPQNDRGEYSNFSINKSCEGITTLDFFAFVHRNVCYICNYDDVILNLFPSREPNKYNLISLRTIKELYVDSFPINLEIS
jgi:hypothetical protein